MFEISTLKEKKISELQKIASDLGIEKVSGLKKQDLAYKIIDHYASKPELKEEDSKPKAKSDESEKSDINKIDKLHNDWVKNGNNEEEINKYVYGPAEKSFTDGMMKDNLSIKKSNETWRELGLK